MTISSNSRKAGPFIGNGTAATFPFTFKVFQASDLEVVKLTVATNVETILVLNTDFTASVNEDQNSSPGGTITLSAGALATGYNLVITSDIENLQPTDLTNQGGFYPEVITDALDRATIQIQQLQTAVDRAALLPITSSADAASLVADIVRLADSADNLDIDANNIASINSVAGSISNVNTVATNISNVNTVAGVSANVTTVATDIAAVNTVAADLNEPVSEIETVAGSITNVNTVGNNIANVNTVAGISANVTTVAGISANVTTVATNNAAVSTVATDIAAVTTVANDLNEPVSEIETVAGSIANVNTVGTNISSVNTTAANNTNITTVATNIADVGTVATNIADVIAVADNETNINAVAGNSTNINAVATNSTNINTAATNIAAITTVANDLNEPVSEIDTVATNIANVNAVGSDIASVNTVAINIVDVHNFADVYQGAKSTPPTLRNDGSALQIGDLYFNSVSNAMFVYASTGWVPAGSSVNGTSRRFRYIATAGQTTFTGADSNGNTMAYDAGFVDVYFNGVRLDQTDYTATSGTNIVLASAAALNDELNIVAFGTFSVASINGVDIINGTVSANKFASDAPAGVSDKTNTSTGYFDLPSGTTAERPGSASVGMTRFNTTLGYPEVYNGTEWVSVGIAGVTPSVEYMAVAGGGGGGSHVGGGGGGGGYLAGMNYAVTAGSAITVTIGAGGNGATNTSGAGGTNGSNSVFGVLTAIGGGVGGSGEGGGATGGSGGGCGHGNGTTEISSLTGGGAATSGQGSRGGGGTQNGQHAAGGGGGAGAFGGNGNSGGECQAGHGGNGQLNSINGTSLFWAGGGGGSSGVGGLAVAGNGGNGGGGGGSAQTSAYAGAGGLQSLNAGGNGSVGAPAAKAGNGGANTGGGGGGGSHINGEGGNGGSGIVVVRYPSYYKAATSTTGSPTITVTNGHRIYQWTSSGSITF